MNQENTTKENGFARWFAIGLILAIFLLPFLSYVFQPEVNQWKAAKTVQLYQRGETQQAIAALETICEKDDDPILKLRLADWKKESDPVAAIKLFKEINEHVDVFGDQPLSRGSLRVVALSGKADCLILQSKEQEAFEEIKRLYDGLDSESASSNAFKNMMAYYRGLCSHEMALALKDIDSVVRDQRRLTSSRLPVRFPVAVSISSALISRYTDQREKAIKVIDSQLYYLKIDIEKEDGKLNDSLYRMMSDFVPLNEQAYNVVNLQREKTEDHLNEWAYLHTVKALLLDDLGRADESKALRQEVIRSKFDPDMILAELPVDGECMAILERGSVYLDTRGYVKHVVGDELLALMDMNVAILASNILVKSYDHGLQNSSTINDVEEARARTERSCAVLHNHRMDILNARSKEELAQADAERIRELGFKPGKHLF